MAKAQDTEGGSSGGIGAAIAFVTEFNQNARIFNEILQPKLTTLQATSLVHGSEILPY